MHHNIFYPTESIYILNFLFLFKTTCNSNRVSERNSMWLVPFFVQNPSESVINARTPLEDLSNKSLEGAFYLFFDAVDDLLAT